MKKLLPLLLVLLLLSACGQTGETIEALTETSTADTTEASVAAPTETEPTDTETETAAADTDTEPASEENVPETTEEPELSLEGLTEDTVAFYRPGAGTGDLVSKKTLEDEALLFYSRSIDAYYAEWDPGIDRAREVYPYMEYALRNGYASFVVADGGSLEEIRFPSEILTFLYPIDQGYIDVTSAGRIPGENREVLCTRVSIKTKEGASEKFAEAFKEAQALVESVPEGYDSFETARYLYEYLTDNVEYDYADYYATDWHLLYDTLIRHKTVCTGFSDTLYYLFNLAGIDCQSVYGTVDNGEGQQIRHEWNAAKLGEYIYYFDATWDVVQMYTVADAYFAVSEGGLNARACHTIDLCLVDPDSSRNFGVPDWWNDTPEGAIKSFLMLKEYAAYPQLLPFLLGLYDDTTTMVHTLPRGFGVYSISYPEFEEHMLSYVTEVCFLKQFLMGKFEEDEGLLACYTGLEVEPVYRFSRILQEEDGKYTAELTSNSGKTYSAVFNLKEQNGRWLVDSFRLLDA